MQLWHLLTLSDPALYIKEFQTQPWRSVISTKQRVMTKSYERPLSSVITKPWGQGLLTLIRNFSQQGKYQMQTGLEPHDLGQLSSPSSSSRLSVTATISSAKTHHLERASVCPRHITPVCCPITIPVAALFWSPRALGHSGQVCSICRPALGGRHIFVPRSAVKMGLKARKRSGRNALWVMPSVPICCQT